MTGSIRLAFCVAVMTWGLGALAHASALRTYVSPTGSDSNATNGNLCAVLTPCRTFQGALGATTVPGGEIDALTPAGYGAIPSTITGTLSIVGVPGAYISAPSGGTAIAISGGTVVIDSIQITGNGAAN